MTASQPFNDVIALLYSEAELTPPSFEQPIVPLSSLIRNIGLIGAEIVGLTVSSASDFLLKRGGAVEPLPSLTSEALAGFLCLIPNYGGCVFVERNDPFTRRRFSAAHELGHYLLHFRPRLSEAPSFDEPMLDAFLPAPTDDTTPEDMPLGQIALPDFEYNTSTFEQMEREANEFAADLLMPTEIVMALCARYRPHLSGKDLALRLAGELLVSRAAMGWRLRHLGLSVSVESELN